MEGIRVFQFTRWHPLSFLGLTQPLWGIHKETMIATWVTLALLTMLIILARLALRKNHSVGQHIVTSFVRYFVDFCRQTMTFNFNHFSFVTSLFTFIFLCNIISTFVPWLEEPTSDINTTFALGITSFLYIQGATIQAHGILGYLKEFFTPFFMFPLHVIGKLSSIVSISFRLFGNIFGGAVIMQIYNGAKIGSWFIETLLMISGLNLVVTFFFGLFEGLIQAFVFFMLTLTYLAIGVQKDENNNKEIL